MKLSRFSLKFHREVNHFSFFYRSETNEKKIKFLTFSPDYTAESLIELMKLDGMDTSRIQYHGFEILGFRYGIFSCKLRLLILQEKDELSINTQLFVLGGISFREPYADETIRSWKRKIKRKGGDTAFYEVLDVHGVCLKQFEYSEYSIS